MSSLRIFDSSENPSKAVENREAVGQPQQRATRGNKGKEKVGVSGAAVDSDNEVHVATERKRRKKMRDLFINLHGMLPQLPAKTDKITIVNEAISYVKTLQNFLQTLKKKKLERIHKATLGHYEQQSMLAAAQMQAFLADQGQSSGSLPMTTSMVADNTLSAPLFPPSFSTYTAQNVVLNLCGNDAQISVCCAKKPGMLAMIVHILQNYNLEVVSAHVSSDSNRCMHMIHACATGIGNVLLPDRALQLEEIFKLAVEEINLWISSA